MMLAACPTLPHKLVMGGNVLEEINCLYIPELVTKMIEWVEYVSLLPEMLILIKGTVADIPCSHV
jgi:hypothetical protein